VPKRSKLTSLDRLSDFEIGTSNAPQATDSNLFAFGLGAPPGLTLPGKSTPERLLRGDLSNFSFGWRIQPVDATH